MSFSPITHPEIFNQIIAAADPSTRLALAATCWRLRRLIAPYNHLVLRCLGERVIDVRAAPTWQLDCATGREPDYDEEVAQWEWGTLDFDGVLPEFPPMVYTSETERKQRPKLRPPRPLHPAMALRAALLANTRIVDIVGPVYDPWLFSCMKNLRTVRLCTVHDQSKLFQWADSFPCRIVTPFRTYIPSHLWDDCVMFGGSVVRHVEYEEDLPYFVEFRTTVLVFTSLEAEWQRAEDPDFVLKYYARDYNSPFVSAYLKAIYPHSTSTAARIWIKLLYSIGHQEDYDDVDELLRKRVLVGLHDMDPGVFFPICPDTEYPVAPDLKAELRAAARDGVELEFLTLDEYNSKHPFDLGHWSPLGVKGYYIPRD